MESFERGIRDLTRPIGGQYPRAWMTDLQDPRSARVFLVGLTQAKTYAVGATGDHDRVVDAWFNRNGQTCRGLYDRVTAGRLSPTRKNLDRFRKSLAARGATAVLETDVVNFSAPIARDPALPANEAGLKKGEVIFRFLLAEVRPDVLVAHGEETCLRLAKVLGAKVPPPAAADGPVVSARLDTPTFRGTVFSIPSLSPPDWSRWSGWAWGYLDRVAAEVAAATPAR